MSREECSLTLYVGHVFCYDCITRFLNDQSTGGRLKCPMCRAPVYRGDRPLKLFIDIKPGNSSSPCRSPRADPGADAELHKLRKEYEALKNSSHEQIQELTRHNNLLSGAKIQLENKLYEAHRTTSASVKNSHRTIRALVAAADTARSEVDTLKTDNARLLAQVEGLTMCKQGNENLLKQLRGSLEATRQAAYTRVRRLTEENTERLEEWEYQAERLIRDANRRVLDKSTECRALSQRIQEVQEDACARISIMQNQLAEAKAITEQFHARGQDSAQLNSGLANTLARVSLRIESRGTGTDFSYSRYI